MKEFQSIEIWNKEAPQGGKEEAALERRRISERLAGARAGWRSRWPEAAAAKADGKAAEKEPQEAEEHEKAQEWRHHSFRSNDGESYPSRRRVPVRLAEARARVVEHVAGGGGGEGRRGGGKGGAARSGRAREGPREETDPDAPGGNQVRVMELAVGDGS